MANLLVRGVDEAVVRALKQRAAIALGNDLTVVTRNTADFAGTGARMLNPYAAA